MLLDIPAAKRYLRIVLNDVSRMGEYRAYLLSLLQEDRLYLQTYYLNIFWEKYFGVPVNQIPIPLLHEALCAMLDYQYPQYKFDQLPMALSTTPYAMERYQSTCLRNQQLIQQLKMQLDLVYQANLEFFLSLLIFRDKTVTQYDKDLAGYLFIHHQKKYPTFINQMMQKLIYYVPIAQFQDILMYGMQRKPGPIQVDKATDTESVQVVSTETNAALIAPQALILQQQIASEQRKEKTKAAKKQRALEKKQVKQQAKIQSESPPKFVQAPAIDHEAAIAPPCNTAVILQAPTYANATSKTGIKLTSNMEIKGQFGPVFTRLNGVYPARSIELFNQIEMIYYAYAHQMGAFNVQMQAMLEHITPKEVIDLQYNLKSIWGQIQVMAEDSKTDILLHIDSILPLFINAIIAYNYQKTGRIDPIIASLLILPNTLLESKDRKLVYKHLDSSLEKELSSLLPDGSDCDHFAQSAIWFITACAAGVIPRTQLINKIIEKSEIFIELIERYEPYLKELFILRKAGSVVAKAPAQKSAMEDAPVWMFSFVCLINAFLLSGKNWVEFNDRKKAKELFFNMLLKEIDQYHLNPAQCQQLKEQFLNEILPKATQAATYKQEEMRYHIAQEFSKKIIASKAVGNPVTHLKNAGNATAQKINQGNGGLMVHTPSVAHMIKISQ